MAVATPRIQRSASQTDSLSERGQSNGAGGAARQEENGDAGWKRAGGRANGGPSRNLWCMQAHYQCKCSESLQRLRGAFLGSYFGHFGREKNHPPCLFIHWLPYPDIFKNQPLITGKTQKYICFKIRCDLVSFASLILGWTADESGFFLVTSAGNNSSMQPWAVQPSLVGAFDWYCTLTITLPPPILCLFLCIFRVCLACWITS